MKKIILLALTGLMMVGCKDNSTEYTTSEGTNVKVIVIDSCEYIKGNYRLAHKGNCRFCKERRQKELKELVEQLTSFSR